MRLFIGEKDGIAAFRIRGFGSGMRSGGRWESATLLAVAGLRGFVGGDWRLCRYFMVTLLVGLSDFVGSRRA